ncbi:MAG: RsmB/NOP family class I SAM-dependent RNA methyltransferase [Myxococcota bacterium]
MAFNRTQIAIQDILTRHKSTGEPVDRLIREIARGRGLGSRERREVADEVFSGLRQKPWPEWFNKRLQKEYGTNYPALEHSLRQRAKPVLAVDIRQSTAQAIGQKLQALAVPFTPSKLSSRALILETDSVDLKDLPGCWWMDDGSQYIAEQIKGTPEDRILDLCAGAGGKTRILLATGAKVTMADNNDKRLAHIDGVQRVVADGRTFKSNSQFDWILIDAPCSGTGTLRHAPDLFGRLKEEDLKQYVKLQNELVANAKTLLSETGKLIYATCSLLEEENHRSFEELELVSSRQLLPSVEGCDGFYIAVFTKQPERYNQSAPSK